MDAAPANCAQPQNSVSALRQKPRRNQANRLNDVVSVLFMILVLLVKALSGLLVLLTSVTNLPPSLVSWRALFASLHPQVPVTCEKHMRTQQCTAGSGALRDLP